MTKIHALTGAQCRPLAFLLTGGNVADGAAGAALGISSSAVIEWTARRTPDDEPAKAANLEVDLPRWLVVTQVALAGVALAAAKFVRRPPGHWT